jgi:hypothetical protein
MCHATSNRLSHVRQDHSAGILCHTRVSDVSTSVVDTWSDNEMTEWEKRNEEYIAELDGSELSEGDYLEALSDLIDRAQSALNAKREEMRDGE